MGRYTDAQRKGIMQNRRDRAAGLRYGYSLTDQGYRDAPEQGASAFALDRFHGDFGGGADPTWQTRIGPDGRVQYKARAQNPDRVRVTGGDWFDAGQVNPNIQKRYERMQDFRNQFGQDKSFQDFSMYRGGQNQFRGQDWVKDPTTGYMVNPHNQYDMRTVMGQRVSQDGQTVMGGGAGTSGYNPWGMPTQGATAGAGIPGGTRTTYVPPGTPAPTAAGSFAAPQAPADLSFDPNDPYGYKKRKGNSSLSLLGAS